VRGSGGGRPGAGARPFPSGRGKGLIPELTDIESFMVSLSNHEASHRRADERLHGSSLDKLGMKKLTMKALSR
jgi:hypothetical protein